MNWMHQPSWTRSATTSWVLLALAIIVFAGRGLFGLIGGIGPLHDGQALASALHADTTPWDAFVGDAPQVGATGLTATDEAAAKEAAPVSEQAPTF
jgi:hypothetical protein